MKERSLCALAVAICGVLIHAVAASAGGVTFAVPMYTLDLSGAMDQVPVAVEAAFAGVEGALIDYGLAPEEVDEIRDRVDESLVQIEELWQTVPPLLPIPLLGGTIEFSLPLIVVDSLRFTGGMLNDDLLRGVARWVGTEIPAPLVDETFDMDGFTGGALIDVVFSSWMMSTDVVKRFDLLVLAVTLGGGVDLVRGEVQPLIDLDLPPEWDDAADDALAALHIDELEWSSFAVHGVVGFEIGPPFLRLYADVRFLLPISSEANWWGLRTGGLAAVLGVVIRF